jgi:hypothetical protein
MMGRVNKNRVDFFCADEYFLNEILIIEPYNVKVPWRP